MRKLFIFLALFSCTSLMAASVDWSIRASSVTDDGYGVKPTGALVYLMQGNNVNEALATVQGKTWDATTAFDSSTLKGNGGSVSKTITLADNLTLDWFVIVFNTDNLDTATKFMVSGVVTDIFTGSAATANNPAVPADSLAGAWDKTTIGATSNGWLDFATTPTPGVPEPTVLALLALGVAGLALRRRA